MLTFLKELLQQCTGNKYNFITFSLASDLQCYLLKSFWYTCFKEDIIIPYSITSVLLLIFKIRYTGLLQV